MNPHYTYVGFKPIKLLPEDLPRIRRKERWIHLRLAKNKTVRCYPDGYSTTHDKSVVVTNCTVNKYGELVTVVGKKVVCLTHLILFSEDNWFTDNLPYVSDYMAALLGVADEEDEIAEETK